MDKNSKFIDLRSNDGISLVGVMIGVAISGILMLTVASFAKNSITSAKYVALMNEKEDLRNLIRVRTNCSKTKAKIGSGNIILYDRLGNPIAAKNTAGEMTIQKWKIKVTAYNASNGAFTIQAVHPQEQTPKYKNLFESVPFTCK